MTENRRISSASVILGMTIAIFIILCLHAIAINYHMGSGCPVEADNSVENAQVFLMGTIGGDYSDPKRDCWRENIVQPVLEDLGVSYFNPVVENWSSENAEIEARAIASADTIVMVITDTHSSIGSLSESGWALLSAIERKQTLIAYIAPTQENRDSERARKIVLSQARTLESQIDNFYLVESLDELIIVVQGLYE